jgi:UDP-glucose 4-epimerase
MKVAIVGNLGFIGSHLARSWSTDKDKLYLFNSRNLFKNSSKKLNNDILKCDLIIWTAGKANPSSGANNATIIKEELANWNSTMNAFSEIKNYTDKRFIFLSSGGCTYTATSLPYFESDQALGTNQYGKMKLRQEYLLSKIFPNNSIIRLSNVYGPGQSIGKGQGVIAEWVSAIRNGEMLKIYGNQNSFRDYLHVFDAVSAIEIIAKDKTRGVVNVGSGEPTTLGELKEYFLTYAGRDIDFDILGSRTTDRNGYYLSIQKLTAIIGWKPTITISEGINKLLNSNLM